jgi:hypothetical protein
MALFEKQLNYASCIINCYGKERKMETCLGTTFSVIQLIAGVVTALATVWLAVLGIWQLAQISEHMRVQGEREKKWATIKACERYDSEPSINQYARKIWEESKSGTDYVNVDNILHDIIGLMNYLDSLAIGVDQGVYNEQIVKDHMKSSIYKSVKAFIKGESGEVDGIAWKAAKPLVDAKGFPCLLKLYDKWFPGDRGAQYQDQT